MIPVTKELCKDINIDGSDKYSSLLRSQFIEIDNNSAKIENKARRLLRLSKTKPNHYDLRNCCNFVKLKQCMDKNI